MLFSAPPQNLDALAQLVRLGSFSLAARALRITQPALSLRIKQLEENIGQKLVRRTRQGISLTPAGTRLLDYVNLRELIDQEMSKELGISQTGSLSGLVRIAGHYSIQMHFALPTLASFFREHAHVQVEHIVREDDLVAPLFERGECDFALLQRPIQKDHYETFFLGHERYILVKSKRYDGRADVYIDSDPTDTLTNDFFAQQVPSKRPKHYHRSFLHNETGIVNAVALGLGRAIVAENELARRNDLVKVPGYKPFLLPIYLQCSKYMQSSKLFSLLRDALVQGGKRQKGCL